MSKIQHIAISCKDNEALAEFYKNTFDMREVWTWRDSNRPGVVAIFLTDGYINLALLPNSGNGPEGITHFGFVVENVETTKETAIAHGAKPAANELPRDGRYAEIFVVDPSGTRVDLSKSGWDVGEGRPEY